MIHFKKNLYYLLGKIHLDIDEIDMTHPLLLHVSDTPSIFFSELSRIIKLINPELIIHTGDLVDNIKLQLYPGAIRHYEREVLSLLKILQYSSAKEIHISIGNHDSSEYIHSKSGRILVHDSPFKLYTHGYEIAFDHYFQNLESLNASLYLYGHDLSEEPQESDAIYLNGISTLNIIDLNDLKIYRYAYPWGIDDARLNKKGIGI